MFGKMYSLTITSFKGALPVRIDFLPYYDASSEAGDIPFQLFTEEAIHQA